MASAAFTELWATGLFKFLVNTAVLGSIELECGGKGQACEPQYTFPVVLVTVFLLVFFLAFGTGGHLNPTITVAAMAAGMLPLVQGIVRIAAQVVGVTLAMVALRAAAPEHLHKHVAPPIPLDAQWAFVVEMTFTFTNVIAAFGCGIWGRYKASVTAAIVILEICVSGAQMDPSGAFAASYVCRAAAQTPDEPLSAPPAAHACGLGTVPGRLAAPRRGLLDGLCRGRPERRPPVARHAEDCGGEAQSRLGGTVQARSEADAAWAWASRGGARAADADTDRRHRRRECDTDTSRAVVKLPRQA